MADMIESWLAGLAPEFALYAPAFRANNVDAEVLPLLTSDDLREMGVASIGHRRLILAAAKPGAARPEPEAEAQGERRLLTVMFCDLVDSTALSVRSDAEDYVELIAQFQQELEAAIVPLGGTVVQFLGDGVMACFGYPLASDHDAERAVAAGLAVLEAVARLPPMDGRPLQVRVGIASGMTVISGTPALRDISAVGETPNLAARMQSMAAPGTLVISEQTRALIGEVFECSDLGKPALKGITEPVRIWQVSGRSATVSRFDALRRPSPAASFVGREGELCHLAQHISSATPLLLSGDPGIGKSRLLREALSRAGLAAPVFLQCSPYNINVALHPLRYLLIEQSGLSGQHRREAAQQQIAALLGTHGLSNPEAVALLSGLLDVADTDPPALRGLGSAYLRGRLMGLLGDILLALVRKAGVLVVEDAHWLDPSTAELLATLTYTLAAEGLPLLVTARTAPLSSWAHTLQRLTLDRLSSADVGLLVVGMAGNQALPDDVISTIAARSDGVPIYAEELARGYLEASLSGTGGDSSSQVPMSLAESILARLDRLVHGRRIASLAAAIGREFPLAILIEVSDLPASVVQAGVGELLAADVLVPGQSQFGEAIRFRHNLVRDAAYQLLLRRQRALLHARIADVLETRFADIARTLPHILATQRGEAGQHDRASAEWERAGQGALARSAYAEASAFFQRALEANVSLPPQRARAQREMDLRLLKLSALICAQGYQSDLVGEETTQIMALAEGLGDAAGLINAMQARWVQMGSANNVHATLEFALKARETMAGASITDRLIATRMCGTSFLFSGALPEALGQYQEFMAQYDPVQHGSAMRMGHSDHAMMVMMGLAETHTLMGAAAEADHWRARVLEAAHLSGRLHDRCHTLTFAGCMHGFLMRRSDEVERNSGQLADLLAGHNLPNWKGYLDLFQGLLQAASGAEDIGLAHARRGLDALIAARAFGNWWYLIYAEACLAARRWAEAESVLHMAKAVENMGERRFEAEQHRLTARLCLGRDGDKAASLASLNAGLRAAERQSAGLLAERLSLDLRALSA